MDIVQIKHIKTENGIGFCNRFYECEDKAKANEIVLRLYKHYGLLTWHTCEGFAVRVEK
jgi:hypothetical protein